MVKSNFNIQKSGGFYYITRKISSIYYIGDLFDI